MTAVMMYKAKDGRVFDTKEELESHELVSKLTDALFSVVIDNKNSKYDMFSDYHSDTRIALATFARKLVEVDKSTAETISYTLLSTAWKRGANQNDR